MMKSNTLMGKAILLLAFCFLAFAPFAQAQEVEITDEDLKNYAIIEMAVEMITSSVSPTVNELIKKQEGMTGARFNELRKMGTTEEKMKAGGAQDWEIKFMTTIYELMQKRKEAASDVINLLVNNSMLGAAKYQAIKEGLSSDANLKARYDQVAENL